MKSIVLPLTSQRSMTFDDGVSPIWKYTKCDTLDFSGPDRSPSSTVILEDEEAVFTIAGKMEELIETFISTNQYRDLSSFWRGEMNPSAYKQARLENIKTEKTKSPLKLFENALDLCHIHFKMFTDFRTDSAMTIAPTDENDLAFVQYITMVLIHMAKFPFSFFRRLGLRQFAFCASMTLEKTAHKEVYFKRVLGGLFEVENFKSPQEIRLFFYKFLCYHIGQKYDGFNAQWKKLNQKGFEYFKEFYGSPKLENTQGFLNIESIRSSQNDQAQILEKLMSNDIKLFSHSDVIIRNKAELMKNILLTIDPAFAILKEWE